MQRIRKLSNDLKEALTPKSDKSDTRRKPSYRGRQPVQAGNAGKIANPSAGYHDSSATTSRSSRDTRDEREKREREGHNPATKPFRQQGTTTSSVAFPSSSSSRSKPTRTKAQEKPVPVPSVNHKQTASAGMSWDQDAGSTSPATSPSRYAPDRWAKPLPSPPGTAAGRQPHRRCPYSPSRYYAMSQSTPHVPFPAQPGTPTTNNRSPASPADAEMSTSHSTQSQSGTPSWPPEGPATIKRQQRTPKGSIDSLYRSQTDMKDFRAPTTSATPRDPGHGHSRAASAPASGDADSPPRRREQQKDPDPALKPLFSDADSMMSWRASCQTTSSVIDPKTSLQVRELSTSRSVHVQPAVGVRRAASHKAQIVYPSYVTGALPPLPDPAPAPAPAPQLKVPTSSSRTPRRAQAGPRSNPLKGRDEYYYTMPRGRAKQDEQIEVSYITLREIAQMEGKKTSEDLAREFAQWDRVDGNAAPASSLSHGGTRPLVVKKRSAMFGAREPRSARR